jgi:hypothetical protein
MKLSKIIDYVYENTLLASEYNNGESCFIVYYGYYTNERYITLFARSFGNEQSEEAFDLYFSLEAEIRFVYPLASLYRDNFSHKNTYEVLA